MAQKDLNGSRFLLWGAVSSGKQDTPDKYSIDDQLAMGHALVKRYNGVVVDELVVHGFSRDFHTLADVITAADDKNREIIAFRRLKEHIDRRTFDVFVCYDADRFGRKSSLVHEVIGRITEDVGAVIYTLFDNFIMDDENSGVVGMIKAFKAQQDIKRLKEYREKGMDKRAQDGRSTTPRLPLFHRRIRDEVTGKEVAVVVDESYRPLWNDLAEVLLRGIAWDHVEQVLSAEYGHNNTDGKPYRAEFMRELVLNPSFWGHAAKNVHKLGKQSVRRRGPWIWDETVPPPEHVTIYYNRRQPVYGGDYAELGERVKVELWRRYQLYGKATPHSTFRFHGLLVCDECSYSLNKSVSARSPNNVYMRCETRYRPHIRPLGCTTTRMIRASVIQVFFEEELQRYMEGLPSAIFGAVSKGEALTRQLEAAKQEHQKTKAQMTTLIQELSTAPEAAKMYFRNEINKLAQQVEHQERSITSLDRQENSLRTINNAEAHVRSKLRGKSEGWLWNQPDIEIHQTLSALLGDKQVVVSHGEIVGAIPASAPGILMPRKRSR